MQPAPSEQLNLNAAMSPVGQNGDDLHASSRFGEAWVEWVALLTMIVIDSVAILISHFTGGPGRAEETQGS